MSTSRRAIEAKRTAEQGHLVLELGDDSGLTSLIPVVAAPRAGRASRWWPVLRLAADAAAHRRDRQDGQPRRDDGGGTDPERFSEAEEME